MNVSSISRFVLGAAIVIFAAEAFSPWFGAAAVCVSLVGTLLAFVVLARLLSRRILVEVDAHAVPPGGDARFAVPQTSLAGAPSDPARGIALGIAVASMLVGAGACWRLLRELSFENSTPLLFAGVVGGALLTAFALKLGLCDRRTAAPDFAGFDFVWATRQRLLGVPDYFYRVGLMLILWMGCSCLVPRGPLLGGMKQRCLVHLLPFKLSPCPGQATQKISRCR